MAHLSEVQTKPVVNLRLRLVGTTMQVHPQEVDIVQLPLEQVTPLRHTFQMLLDTTILQVENALCRLEFVTHQVDVELLL